MYQCVASTEHCIIGRQQASKRALRCVRDTVWDTMTLSLEGIPLPPPRALSSSDVKCGTGRNWEGPDASTFFDIASCTPQQLPTSVYPFHHPRLPLPKMDHPAPSDEEDAAPSSHPLRGVVLCCTNISPDQVVSRPSYSATSSPLLSRDLPRPAYASTPRVPTNPRSPRLTSPPKRSSSAGSIRPI